MFTDSTLMLTLPVVLGLVGLLLGLAGSTALAFSLNRAISALSLATDAHDFALETLINPDPRVPVVRFTGTDVHVEQGRKSAARWTRVGLWLLVFSFAFQAAALFPALLKP